MFLARLGTIGGVLLLVRRSMRQHAVSTTITMLTAALASGLVMSVFAINEQTRDAFAGGEVGAGGELAILGARGSPLQLVLNTVFHLETSPGNIPWKLYQEIARDPRVAAAAPYAVGDNYRGFRIVGTTPERFIAFEARPGRKFELAGPNHRWFDPQRMEAVVGSFVADKTGLTVGSRFRPFHGLIFNEKEQHPEEYVVVGVLKPTNSPTDRAIWIPIEGHFRMTGHYLRATGEAYQAKPDEEIPDEHKEISAVMLRLRSFQHGILLQQQINNQGKVATLAWPIAQIMADLFNKLGWAHRVLALVAYLVIAVAAASILASVYNTINERRREFAILRALGARRRTVFAAILAEAGAIAGCGALLGIGVYAAILAVAGYVIRAQTGVVLDLLAYHPVLWLAPLGMTCLGVAAGLLPAFKAYATDVATNLAPIS